MCHRSSFACRNSYAKSAKTTYQNRITKIVSRFFISLYLKEIIILMAKGEHKNIVIKNKKASFDYEFIEKYVAGIVLVGTEIKSIRLGKAGLVDAYCIFSGNELYVRGLNISIYWWGNINNHEPLRERKLLLERKELNKLQRRTKEKGLTIVATKLFINDKGLAKIEIALARGKKEYDKRESIKEKDLRRDMSRKSYD